MKYLVVYDSAYGNTKKVAEAIAKACHGEAILVNAVAEDDVAMSDLLIVGSPTQGGMPTKAIQDFIKGLGAETIAGKRVAVFDTRFAIKGHGYWLGLVMKVIGFAAQKMAAGFSRRGAIVVVNPKGFIVKDTEGPLTSAELEKAAIWGRMLRRI